MIHFECDYVEGGHPKILEHIVETNMEQMTGYSTDRICDSARAKIKALCGREDADVHFMVGGTQTNLVSISAILRTYQGVLAAVDGHIACHETGAIEATGHKVLTLPAKDGKITGEQVREYCKKHNEDGWREHTVKPGMVYISFPTECGSLYTKAELADISNACHENNIPLYIDGARMGYGLMCEECEVTLKDIAAIADMFYIGGTKCGALMGEALVILNESLKSDFRYIMKQHGALMAKGRLLGIQFDVLFEDGLYFDVCRQADEQAVAIRNAFEAKGIRMLGSSKTNQQFPILTDEQLKAFDGKFGYEFWEKVDDSHTAVRFCTCWATKWENVNKLIETINTL